jgi:pheromone alpha factor receptor
MAFDPYSQNITILVPSSSSSSPISIPIPIPLIDSFNDETVSIVINYGAQLGASITMLLVILFATPSSKFLRAANLLHILALLICIVRTVLLAFYFLSPFSHFYQVYSNDYSQVPAWNYRTSIAGTVFSMLLSTVTDAALMNQAWTMVSLWPNKTKYTLSFLSMLITLMAVAFRLAYTVIQCEGIYTLTPPTRFAWLIRTTLIWNTCSICWFCALFNSKLIIHLITNRGVLPSRRAMNPMEVLIMANGILMIVPGKINTPILNLTSHHSNKIFSSYSHLRRLRMASPFQLRIRLSNTNIRRHHPPSRLSRGSTPGHFKPKPVFRLLQLSFFFRRRIPRTLQKQSRLRLSHASQSWLAIHNVNQQQHFRGSIPVNFTEQNTVAGPRYH